MFKDYNEKITVFPTFKSFGSVIESIYPKQCDECIGKSAMKKEYEVSIIKCPKCNSYIFDIIRWDDYNGIILFKCECGYEFSKPISEYMFLRL